MQKSKAFTLLELLITIGILATLLAILLPTVSRAREQAKQISCMSNMRQITMAFLEYTNDSRGRFLPPDSSIAQAGLASSTDQSEVIPALYRGYAHASRVFHCPSDDRAGKLSYSINDFLGGTWPAFTHPLACLPEARHPAEVFVLIEEINRNPKVANNNGGFVVQPPPSPVWIDFPAVPHMGGTAITFLDGHCEYWVWSDPQTSTLSAGKPFPSTPGSPDLARLQAALGNN